MIRVRVLDPGFNQAYANAYRALPVEPMESPKQYGRRWRELYKCRVDPESSYGDICYIFDRDEDYTMFMLRWS